MNAGHSLNPFRSQKKLQPRPAAALDLLLSALIRERWADFEAAKSVYQKLIQYRPRSVEAKLASKRLLEIDKLIEEKNLYERIDQQARQVLSEVGMNIANSPAIMKLLLDADAIDTNNQEAPLVPLKAEYVERCLDLVPREFPIDPGPNAFGTGGTPPFLMVDGENTLRPAKRSEFEEIVHMAGHWSGVVDIFSVPVQTERSMSDYECAQAMDRGFSGLKMIPTRKMSDQEAARFKGREDWLDGTSLMSSFMPMKNMVDPFIRSAGNGSNLLLLDLSIAGASAPNSPEALLTYIHSQVLFMMVLVQTIQPGTLCVHGGIPGVVGPKGDLSYSSPSQALINEAMARLNLWVTGFPSAQSGGSTSLTDSIQEAVEESRISRNRLRRYGAHMIRHAFGTLGNLQFFSLEKFSRDCEAETKARAELERNAIGEMEVLPLYLPADDMTMEAIHELAVKGNPKITDHSLRNVHAFRKWEERVAAEAKKMPSTMSEDLQAAVS